MLRRNLVESWGEIKRLFPWYTETVTRVATRGEVLEGLIAATQAKLATLGESDADPREFMAQIGEEMKLGTTELEYDREYAAMYAYLGALCDRDQRIYNIWQETNSTLKVAERMEMGADEVRDIITTIYTGLRRVMLDLECEVIQPESLPAPATENH